MEVIIVGSVAGGGFIGLEMAENLRELGSSVEGFFNIPVDNLRGGSGRWI